MVSCFYCNCSVSTFPHLQGAQSELHPAAPPAGAQLSLGGRLSFRLWGRTGDSGGDVILREDGEAINAGGWLHSSEPSAVTHSEWRGPPTPH